VLFRFDTANADMTAAECNYGILPIPKYDLSQENYMTSSVCYVSTVVCVPRILSEAEADKAGFMLEVMASLSEVTTFPTYVEKLLEMKKSPDPESTRVLQLVFGNMTYDFMYSYYVNHFPRIITRMVFQAGTDRFASTIKNYKDGLELALEDLELAFLSHES
jgi:hypothetical protein